MRFLVLLFIYNVQVRGFLKFKDFDSKSSFSENAVLSGYKKGVSVTGKYFQKRLDVGGLKLAPTHFFYVHILDILKSASI